ncbi:MAG TPA: cell envelope biogenesis protein TolA [Afipia sp.]
MIQKFLSKYITEVIPSVVATVLGAYIVTHYINAKPDADKPAAAVTAPATAVKAVSGVPDKPKEPAKSEPAKSESAKTESPKIEPAKSESVKIETAPAKSEAVLEAEKSGEKSAQAARVLRHHQIVVKERAAKAVATEKSAPVEASAMPEDRRDANDIARAAIERLRGAEPRSADTKTPERKSNTVGYAPAVAAPQTYAPQTYAPPPVQAAPPPAAYVPPPAREAAIPAPTPVIAPMPPATNVAPLPMPPPPASVARTEDPSRPTPPADIPSRPLDIRAKDNSKDNPSVAEDVVSAAKNAFEAVLPR